MPDRNDLCGYQSMPEGSLPFTRLAEVVYVKDMTAAPFLVRTGNHVDYIQRGYLCLRADGTLYGVETEELAAHYTAIEG
jgi:hypothetical protein